MESDLNEKTDIISNYFIEDNILVKRGVNGKYEEYDKTYFVIKISKEFREDLASFDYVASSAELVTLLNNNDDSFSDKYIETVSSAYDMDLVKKMLGAISDGNLEKANNLFKHVPSFSKNTFSALFGNILN